MPYGDWDTYYAHLVEWVANDGDTYARDFKTYGNDANASGDALAGSDALPTSAALGVSL